MSLFRHGRGRCVGIDKCCANVFEERNLRRSDAVRIIYTRVRIMRVTLYESPVNLSALRETKFCRTIPTYKTGYPINKVNIPRVISARPPTLTIPLLVQISQSLSSLPFGSGLCR